MSAVRPVISVLKYLVEQPFLRQELDVHNTESAEYDDGGEEFNSELILIPTCIYVIGFVHVYTLLE